MKNNIDEHLQKYGLRHFALESEFESWQGGMLTAAQHVQVFNLANLVSRNSIPEHFLALMDYIAKARIAHIVQSTHYDVIKENGLHVIPLLKGRNAILDVGCASGYLTTLYAISNPDSQVTGVDFSSENIELAKERAEQFGIDNVAFILMDITAYVLGGPFDVIVGTQCFEFVQDLEVVISNLISQLYEDGILVSVTQHPGVLGIKELFQQAGLNVRTLSYFDATDLGKTTKYGIVIGERN